MKLRRIFRAAVASCLMLLSPRVACSGGGPQNVLVVANENSRDSMDMARYYMDKRQIPSRNLVLVRAPRGEENMSAGDFEKRITKPILTYLDKSGLAPQIQFIVLCPDLPSRVNDIEGATAVLFYGYKNAPPSPPCTMPENTKNPYFMQERAFDWRRMPSDVGGTRRLVTMLRAGSIESLKVSIDRSIKSGTSRPEGTFYLHKSPDPHRNVRHNRFAEFDFHYRFFTGMPRVIYASCFPNRDILGFMDGVHDYTTNFWAQIGFLPGALADHMTSAAGRFPETPQHAPSWKWLDAGAAGSYGTVSEPCNPLQKFPDPLVFLWYARGFSLAESYWMSVANPYQGVFLGDPLTAPFATPPRVRWLSPTNEAVVSGVVTLRWEGVAIAPNKPCGRSDLYLNDFLTGTVTSLAPMAGTEIAVFVAGYPFRYTVQPGDGLSEITAGLESVFRQSPTPIRAAAFGDRLMLACMDPSIPTHRLDYRVEISAPAGTESPLQGSALSPFFMRSVYLLDKLRGMEYPRGCIIFSCGRERLEVEYAWDTRNVRNGRFNLCAVVMEGTAVETQGSAFVQVSVANP